VSITRIPALGAFLTNCKKANKRQVDYAYSPFCDGQCLRFGLTDCPLVKVESGADGDNQGLRPERAASKNGSVKARGFSTSCRCAT
jgi:hypothetical protein